MAGQQYVVEKPFAYNAKNKIVEHRETGAIVSLEDDAALQAGDAVTPLGHDGPAQKSPVEGLSERSTRDELEAAAAQHDLDPQQYATKKELFDALQSSGNQGDSGQS